VSEIRISKKIVAVVNAALGEAMGYIAKDKRAAVELYLKASKEKLTSMSWWR
jgi:hypothetical protein